ncbi:MAG: metallophosphoesterase [bacterium]|mgnify:FL=1|jgi:Icc-related predicted phosphoesterase
MTRRQGSRVEERGAPRERGTRRVRIAAVGDLHFDGTQRGALVDLFSAINAEADILALCGDLTTHGHPDHMRAFVKELTGVEVPIVAVYGNHDHEYDATEELTAILAERGVHVLDGGQVVIQGIGFAGAKGFAGGYGRGALAPFGERLIKDFVGAAIEEAIKLETALRTLTTDVKVVLMHYSPVTDTLRGEPEYIYPFLGSSRLLEPLETHGASVIFHGHAHAGQLEGRTPSGVPVFNVALPLLRQHGLSFRIWETPAPERRRAAQPAAGGGERAGGAAA